jgi:hypothetical protein
MRERDIAMLAIGLLIGYLLAHASETSPAPGDVVRAAGSLVGPLMGAL